MTSADFCSISRQVTLKGAKKILLQVLPIVRSSSPSAASGDAWTLITRYGPSRELLQKKNSMPAKQISPDKNVNCHYTTAAFTLSPESWASTCCAGSPRDQALYAVSVRRLIVLHSGLPLPPVALACGSTFALLKPFRPSLAEMPLPSSNVYAIVNTMTGFTHRGLPPHKFTPMPGVHKAFPTERKKRAPAEKRR